MYPLCYLFLQLDVDDDKALGEFKVKGWKEPEFLNNHVLNTMWVRINIYCA